VSVYRPVPCLGIALGNLPPCTGCLRLVASIDAGQAWIKPEVSDGKCEDFIAGRRPVAPVRVTAPATPIADQVHPAIDGEDLPWFGMDFAGEDADR